MPVSIARLHSPKRDMAIVAAAGPSESADGAVMTAVLLLAHSLVHTAAAEAVPLLLMSVCPGYSSTWC